jgi:two-component system OmpR family sensor kinase
MLINADQLRTRQILRNLLSNARRWGGDNIRVSAQEIGATAVLIVADDGPGVPSDVETRLFTRYIHEGDNPLTAGSIGLGLSVVKILAEGMAGEVRYERSGGWTRFVVELPLAEAVSQPVRTASTPEERSFEVA